MVLLIDRFYHHASFDNIHSSQKLQYNMSEMRKLSNTMSYMLFLQPSNYGRYRRKYTNSRFLPVFRLISAENVPNIPKYYQNSPKAKEILETPSHDGYFDNPEISDYSVIHFYYELKFNLDKDTPQDPKIPIRTFSIETEDGESKKVDISEDVAAYPIINPFFEQGKSLVIGYKTPHKYYIKDFAEDLVVSLSEYYDIKASIKILQTEFRVNDIIDNCEEEFHFTIFEKLLKKNKMPKSVRDLKYDFSHEIEEKNIQKAIQKLIGWKVPEESDKNVEEFEAMKFELLNDHFYYMPLRANPLRGYIVPKKFYKNKALFTGKHLLDVDILVYDPKTLQTIEEFHRTPTDYSDMDVIANIERILDILSIKYKGSARATITISLGSEYRKSIIVEDSFYHENIYYKQQDPMERIYEMIFSK